jgi:signal peptidase I
MNSHPEKIKCPQCEKESIAEVEHTPYFPSYVYQCPYCEYWITESEWEKVEMKVLRLTLHKKAFDVMVTGEKMMEFRKPTKWIMSRLEGKHYDIVEFTNGYGADRPRFTCEYKEYTYSALQVRYSYSNDLSVNVSTGDVVIHLGKIISKQNLKQ